MLSFAKWGRIMKFRDLLANYGKLWQWTRSGIWTQKKIDSRGDWKFLTQHNSYPASHRIAVSPPPSLRHLTVWRQQGGGQLLAEHWLHRTVQDICQQDTSQGQLNPGGWREWKAQQHQQETLWGLEMTPTADPISPPAAPFASVGHPQLLIMALWTSQSIDYITVTPPHRCHGHLCTTRRCRDHQGQVHGHVLSLNAPFVPLCRQRTDWTVHRTPPPLDWMTAL
jgi:hypothetical protein